MSRKMLVVLVTIVGVPLTLLLALTSLPYGSLDYRAFADGYYQNGTPTPDTGDDDGDGLPDGDDNCPRVHNPAQENNDGEKIDLGPAVAFDDGTNPDGDGVGDACDGDDDNDGHGDDDEDRDGLSRYLSDSDGDLVIDLAEIILGSDPRDPASMPSGWADADKDLLPDFAENFLGTNPNDSDSDDDGVSDGVEVLRLATNALNADTDGDGCRDRIELATVNGDRAVNASDLGLVASRYGPMSSGRYLKNMDQNRDRYINALDLGRVASAFGNYC